MQYQLVEESAIEHKNEYFEIRIHEKKSEKSLFFTSNEENLEDVAAAIVSRHASHAAHWQLIPHRKKH